MAVTFLALRAKLNTTCSDAIMQAVALASSRTHFDVELEHWLLKLLEKPINDLTFLFRQYGADVAKVKSQLERSLGQLKTGCNRLGALADEILDAIREAWVFGSLEQGAHKVRSGHLLAAILTDRALRDRVTPSAPELENLSVEKLQSGMSDPLPRVAAEANEQEAAARPAGAGASPGSERPSRRQTPRRPVYCQPDHEGQTGSIDPVVGRDPEIRQVIGILTRAEQPDPLGDAASAKPPSSGSLPASSRATCETAQAFSFTLDSAYSGRGRSEGEDSSIA